MAGKGKRPYGTYYSTRYGVLPCVIRCVADGVKKRCPSSQRSGWLIRFGFSLSRLTQTAYVGIYSIQVQRVPTVEIHYLSCRMNNG